MKKLYTSIMTGSYFIDGVNLYVVKDDTATLTAIEAVKYADYFEISDSWNAVFDDVTVTTVGGAITKSYTVEEATSADLKLVKVEATTVGTMPAGAIATIEVYNTAGTVVETKYEKFAQLATTTGSVYFTGSYLNSAASYKITVIAPQAAGSSYDVTITSTEVIPESVTNVEVVSTTMVSGVNNVQLKSLDEDAALVSDNSVLDVYISADYIGTPAAASVLSGIAAGTKGEIIEFADDQYFKVATEDGLMDLSFTPANVGTPTETLLTFATAVPTTGDTVTFGTEVYEFTTNGTTALTTPTNIRIDMTGDDGAFTAITTFETASQGFKYVFDANTAYEATTSGAAAIITITALKFFETYNDLPTTTSITSTATGVYEDTTFGGATGSSTTGVDPTSFYYLAVKYGDKTFMTERLPYQA